MQSFEANLVADEAFHKVLREDSVIERADNEDTCEMLNDILSLFLGY